MKHRSLVAMTARGMALSIGCCPPTSISSKDTFDEQMGALGKESIRVDSELDTATAAQGPVKTPQEAGAMLKIFENFCAASEDLDSRQNALYAHEHKSLEPVRIEQHQALSAVCEISQDMVGYLADPAHKFNTVGGQTSIIGASIYRQKQLAFDAANVRLDKANAALEVFNSNNT